jgi:ADA HAT complex component 1
MLRLLSWNAYDKPSIPSAQMFVPADTSGQPSTALASATMKRKRPADYDSVDGPSAHTQSPPRPKTRQPSAPNSTHLNEVTNNSHLQTSEGLPTPLSSPTEIKMEGLLARSDAEADRPDAKAQRHRQRTRQVIQQQINLEILVKHNELRLIDQEIAKCQTVLEQLRRCTEIPYPSIHLSETVTTGRGPALRKSFTGRLPTSPAPWGVTDGPYSRHYSKWLLSDSQFDGGEPEAPVNASGKRPAKGRIRGNFAEDHSVGVQSRSQRGGSLQALPAGYGPPKEKASGPLLLKRKSDGVMVKLVCPDCGRHDFGSAQGFINHCRIGHARNFTSHDAAAEKCGEPVEYDEHGAMVGIEPTTTLASSFVHPLIRSARLLQSDTIPTWKSAPSVVDGAQDSLTTPMLARTEVSPEFRASQLTPHLSSLIKNKGLGLDLQDMVTDAKIKVEWPEVEDEDVDEESESPTPVEAYGHHPHVAGTRQITKPFKSPHTSPLLQSRLPAPSSGAARVEQMAGEKPRGYLPPQPSEPSPTMESNQAPSLIDDDEDMEPHSPTSSSGSDDEEGEVDFHVQDEDDSPQVELPRSDFQPSCAQAAAPEPAAARARRPSALRRHVDSREEKHVSFVSPSPAPEMASPERKRRKITK